jgi:competence ComEA-like helix-hairpin-helix protein
MFRLPRSRRCHRQPIYAEPLGAESDDMISRGANASDEEASEIVAYLTKYFGKVNINTATQPQLQETLGLTEKEAQPIIAYRDHNGAIKDFEQLKSVPGVIGEKLQAKRNLVAFTK